MTDIGLIAIAAGLAMLSCFGSSIGQGLICARTVEGMARNPEMYSKLRSTMIIGCAITETCGIYALLISILLIFVYGG